MMKVREIGRGLFRCLWLAAAAILVLSAAFSERAEALSLINPGAVPTAKNVSDGLTIEVHGGHGGGGRGGGAGHGGGSFHGGPAFHASGIRSGGAVFRGSSFRAGPAFRGAGIRYGGPRYGAYRHGGYRFGYRHHFHRHFYAPYYDDAYPYYHHRCRIIRTYYGPRRVCHWHHRWHRHHWHRHGFPFRLYW